MKVTITEPFSDLTASIYRQAPGMFVLLKKLIAAKTEAELDDLYDQARALMEKIEEFRLPSD